MPLAATVANSQRTFDPNNKDDNQHIRAAKLKLEKALGHLKKVDAAIVSTAPVAAWGLIPVLNWLLPTTLWGAAVATCSFAVGNRMQAAEKYTEALTEAIELYTFCMQQDAPAALRCYAVQELMQTLSPLMSKADFCRWDNADLNAQAVIAGGETFLEQVKGTVSNAAGRVQEQKSDYHQFSHKAVKDSVVKLIGTNEKGAHLLSVEYRLYGDKQFSTNPKEGLKSLTMYAVDTIRPYGGQVVNMVSRMVPAMGSSR